MKKINLLFILVILSFFAIFVYAAQYYQVNSGATVTIDEHGVCKNVKNNNNANAMFVPTNTAGEWTAFRNNALGVTIGDCGGTCSCNIIRYIYETGDCSGHYTIYTLTDHTYLPDCVWARDHAPTYQGGCWKVFDQDEDEYISVKQVHYSDNGYCD